MFEIAEDGQISVSKSVEMLAHSRIVERGNQLTEALINKGTALGFILSKAMDEAKDGILEMLSADLHSADGVRLALAAQAKVRHYSDMLTWVSGAIMDAETAESMMREELGDNNDLIPELWRKPDGPSNPD